MRYRSNQSLTGTVAAAMCFSGCRLSWPASATKYLGPAPLSLHPCV